MTASSDGQKVIIAGTGPREEKFTVGKDGVLDLVYVVLPGVSTDLTISVDIEGEGAQVDISGLYVCAYDEKVGINVDLVHKVGHCTSRQLFKGVAGGSAKAGFYGKIVVAQDAQKTEAYQENHNLLVSDGAVVDTKPQLEIYADDVKCSHGATIGRLNEEEQFYMRSRGITETEARKLQMLSFLYPVIDNIKDEVNRNVISDLVGEALSKL